MLSTALLETDRVQVEAVITAKAWGGTAAADRISLWASVHARDLISNNNLELRLLEREPFLAADADEMLSCRYRPLGSLANVRRVPLPSDVAGIWLTLVGLATDARTFENTVAAAAYTRLAAIARKLVADHYSEYTAAFALLCGGAPSPDGSP